MSFFGLFDIFSLVENALNANNTQVNPYSPGAQSVVVANATLTDFNKRASTILTLGNTIQVDKAKEQYNEYLRKFQVRKGSQLRINKAAYQVYELYRKKLFKTFRDKLGLELSKNANIINNIDATQHCKGNVTTINKDLIKFLYEDKSKTEYVSLLRLMKLVDILVYKEFPETYNQYMFFKHQGQKVQDFDIFAILTVNIAEKIGDIAQYVGTAGGLSREKQEKAGNIYKNTLIYEYRKRIYYNFFNNNSAPLQSVMTDQFTKQFDDLGNKNERNKFLYNLYLGNNQYQIQENDNPDKFAGTPDGIQFFTAKKFNWDKATGTGLGHIIQKNPSSYTNYDVATLYLSVLQILYIIEEAYEQILDHDNKGFLEYWWQQFPEGKEDKDLGDEEATGVPSSSSSADAQKAAADAAAAAEARKEVLQKKIATANRLRLNEQAALMLNVDYLITKQPKSAANILNRVQFNYENFVLLRNSGSIDSANSTEIINHTNEIGGGHIDITSALLKNNNTKYFLKEIPPSVLSILTPSIKLYKVFYVNKTGKNPNSPGFPWRVPFDDVPYKFQRKGSPNPLTTNIQEYALEELIQGTGRLHNIGIKSFSYKYVGTNPAEVNTNIQAELELYFQDVSDIVKTMRVDGEHPNFSPPLLSPEKEPFNTNNIEFCYADLIADQPREQKVDGQYQYNEKYFRIKAVVGYNMPPNHVLSALYSAAEITQIKNAINANQVAFYLTPTRHDLTFEENGSINLKINYQAALTSILSGINALEIAKKAYRGKKDLDKKLIEVQNELRLNKLASPGGGRDIQEKEIKKRYIKIKEEIANFELELENKKNIIYSEVFSRLVGISVNRQQTQQMVYSAKFSKEALGVYANGEIQTKSGYTPEVLQSARNVTNFDVSSWEGDDALKDLTVSIKPNNLIRLEDPYEDLDILNNEYVSITSKQSLEQPEAPKEISADIISKINSIITKQNKIIAEQKKVQVDFQEEAIRPAVIKDETIEVTKLDANSKPVVKNKKEVKEKKTVKNYDEFFQSLSAAKLVLGYLTSNKVIKIFKSGEVDTPAILSAELAKKNIAKKYDEYIGKSRQAPNSDGTFTVKFAFLGDIMDIFCGLLHDPDIITDPVDRPRFIFTDFYLNIPVSIKNNRMLYKKYNLNLSDIPISIEMLKSFLLEKLIKPRASSFSLVRLILSIISDIVAPAVSPSYFGNKAVFNKVIRASTLTLCLPTDAANKKDLVLDQNIEDHFGNKTLTKNDLNNLLRKQFSTQIGGRKLLNYMIFYCSNQLPNSIKNNGGDTVQDENIGVYHFFVGSDKGCLKKINFSRTDMPFYSEAKLVSSQGNKNINLRLREVFNATIEMFGNNIYRPGDFIYIEPLFYIGQKAIDLQTKIGLGGYYQVINVDTKITEGSYVTIMKLVFYASIEQEGKNKKTVTADEAKDDILDEGDEEVTTPNADSPKSQEGAAGTPASDSAATVAGGTNVPQEAPNQIEPAATKKQIKALTADQISYIEKTLNFIATKRERTNHLIKPDKLLRKSDYNLISLLQVYITKSGKLADSNTRRLITDDGDISPLATISGGKIQGGAVETRPASQESQTGSEESSSAGASASEEAAEADVPVPESQTPQAKPTRKPYLVNDVHYTTADNVKVYHGNKDGEYVAIGDDRVEKPYKLPESPVSSDAPKEIPEDAKKFEDYYTKSGTTTAVLIIQEKDENNFYFSFNPDIKNEGFGYIITKSKYEILRTWLKHKKFNFTQKIKISAHTTPKNIFQILSDLEEDDVNKNLYIEKVYYVSPQQTGSEASGYRIWIKNKTIKDDTGNEYSWFTEEELVKFKSLLETIGRSDLEGFTIPLETSAPIVERKETPPGSGRFTVPDRKVSPLEGFERILTEVGHYDFTPSAAREYWHFPYKENPEVVYFSARMLRYFDKEPPANYKKFKSFPVSYAVRTDVLDKYPQYTVPPNVIEYYTGSSKAK